MAFTSRRERFLLKNRVDDHEHHKKGPFVMRHHEQGLVDTRSWGVSAFDRHQHLIDLITDRDHYDDQSGGGDDEEKRRDRRAGDLRSKKVDPSTDEADEDDTKRPIEQESDEGEDTFSGDSGEGDGYEICEFCRKQRLMEEITVKIRDSRNPLSESAMPFGEIEIEHYPSRDNLQNQLVELSEENMKLQKDLQQARDHEKLYIEQLKKLGEKIDRLEARSPMNKEGQNHFKKEDQGRLKEDDQGRLMKDDQGRLKKEGQDRWKKENQDHLMKEGQNRKNEAEWNARQKKTPELLENRHHRKRNT